MGRSGLKAGGVGCRFADALDYVWYDRDRLAVRREIPLPSETELQGFIPSERFPSDHLSVRDTALESAELPDARHQACPEKSMQCFGMPFDSDRVYHIVTALQVVFDLEWREQQPADGTEFDAPIAGGLRPNRGGLASASSSRVFPAEAANIVFGLLALKNGGVIAVPTDTLYGMHACHVLKYHACCLASIVHASWNPCNDHNGPLQISCLVPASCRQW